MEPKVSVKYRFVRFFFSFPLSKMPVILTSCMSNAFKLNKFEIERTNMLPPAALYKNLTNA